MPICAVARINIVLLWTLNHLLLCEYSTGDVLTLQEMFFLASIVVVTIAWILVQDFL